MSAVALADLTLTAKKMLHRELRPMHYAELARQCVQDLGMTDCSDVALRAMAEDLREKGLAAQRAGMAYVGRPHCVGVLKEWFTRATLFTCDTVRLDITSDIATEASAEAALRFPHVLNKFHRSDREHAEKLSRGLLIEKAVSRWFQQQWPSLWRPPDNDGRYTDPCGHDFKLVTRAYGELLVDVAGPNSSNRYGAVRNKPQARLHVLAEDEGLSVVVRGVQSSRVFAHTFSVAEESESIFKLMVMLNSECHGLDYREIARCVR